MDPGEATRYRFGRFVLAAERRQLWDGDALVPLGTRAFDLLLALVEQAGLVVGKGELLDRLWGKVAVGDNTLQVHVSILRRTLGDNADYIVTHQGLGYQFVGPVELMLAQAGSAEAPSRAGGGNLPYPPTRLIGRDTDMTAIATHLGRARVVTITGAGGIGKTRLAIESGRLMSATFPDGVWLVELAALRNPDLIASTIVTTLGLGVADFALIKALERRSLLLILDNCEHLIEAAAAQVQAILDGTPGISVLATSREALRCAGETVYSLKPFALAPASALRATDARAFPAVEFFIERAAAADTHFDFDDAKALPVATICRRLDGIALALELAATQVPLLGIEALSTRLDKQFRSLSSGRRTALPRHRTMQAALDWSYELLDPSEQLLLRRLTIFRGSFTLDAAESVACDAHLPEWEIIGPLTALVAKSLLVLDRTGREARYRLLETTRDYAREKLEAEGELPVLRARHSAYLRAVWDELHRKRETMPEPDWLAMTAHMLDDLRAALEWGFGPTGEVGAAIALAGTTRPLWWALALRLEGLRWAELALTRVDAATPVVATARLRLAAAELREMVAMEAALTDARDAIDLFRTVDEPVGLARALAAAARRLVPLGRFAEAEPFVLECLDHIRGLSLPAIEMAALSVLGRIYAETARPDAAKTCFARAQALARAAGETRSELAMQLNLSSMMFAAGEFDAAASAGRAVLRPIERTRDGAMFAVASINLTGPLLMLGQLDEALTVARDAMPILRSEGLQLLMLDFLALRLGLAGRIEDAARVAGYADRAAAQHLFDRQHDTMPVVVRLDEVLAAALPAARRSALAAEGAALTEEQVIVLALT